MKVLNKLRGVTIVTADFDAAISAYSTYLDYKGEQGLVDAATARSWSAPNAEGCRMATLYPASGVRRFIRFVESQVSAPCRPFRTTGWITAEICVEHLQQTADALKGSPFEVIGPPARMEFSFTDKLSAMQVFGSSGEILYLTHIAGEVPGFDLPRARAAIDCLFVAVLATTTFDETIKFYADLAGTPVPAVITAPIGIIAKAHGLDPAHPFDLTVVGLGDATAIEIDRFLPEHVGERPIAACGLTSGIAIVSFETTDSIRSGTVLTGPSGELVELLAP